PEQSVQGVSAASCAGAVDSRGGILMSSPRRRPGPNLAAVQLGPGLRRDDEQTLLIRGQSTAVDEADVSEDRHSVRVYECTSRPPMACHCCTKYRASSSDRAFTPIRIPPS